nr:NYN domain-containing protein [Pseudanabaena sp. FACHB-2040]
MAAPGGRTAAFPQPDFALQTPRAERGDAIAVLLLDAENITLPEPAESWIAERCQYQIQTKIAFGNWRKLGNQDQNLHQRGYQMIHVPQGKNGADLKMTALGASMLVLDPKVKEVIVCSSDQDLNHLRQMLAAQGLKVYQVRRQNNTLTLVNGNPHAPQVFSLTPPIEAPSLSVGLQFLRAHLANSPEFSSPFNQLGCAFYQHFKVSLRQFISHHGYTQTPKAFLESQPDFVLLASEADRSLCIPLKAQLVAAQPQATPSKEAKDFTPRTLEIVSRGILKRLIQEQSTDKIRLEVIAVQFQKQHGQSIKSILKQHQLATSLPKFFQSLKGITVEQDGKYWLVSLQ